MKTKFFFLLFLITCSSSVYTTQTDKPYKPKQSKYISKDEVQKILIKRVKHLVNTLTSTKFWVGLIIFTQLLCLVTIITCILLPSTNPLYIYILTVIGELISLGLSFTLLEIINKYQKKDKSINAPVQKRQEIKTYYEN